ncbi:MAG: flagellar basal body L-ring protein FlgH [Candidatus Sumerlaeota bacterium]|nr:flagellar basal body L-ring protein FlgH [Candidatus Sumerlaeota bacterium]
MATASCARQQPEPIVVHATPKKIPTAGPGSLWVGTSQTRWSLIRDSKALEVGDIVMVNVINNTTAAETAKTDVNRKSEIKADIQHFFGLETALPGAAAAGAVASAAGAAGVIPPLIESKSNSNFAADGTTKRDGKLVGKISCEVYHVYPNGNMKIHGSQAVAINNERSILALDGTIRPQDVTWDNSVLSTQVSDLSLEYTARGVVADVQRPGILMRAFAWLWPF